MASLVQKGILQTRLPFMQFKRFRGKINIQRPRQPHYERARLIAVTTPIFSPKPINLNCFDQKTKGKPHNPYNDIIAKEVLNWLNHSKMTAFFHLNPITSDDLFKIKVALFKNNMHLKAYGKTIIEQAIIGSKYEAVMPLFESKHCIVFSPDQNVPMLLKLLKKVPQMILIGGIVEGTLMSRNEITQFAQLPDLQTAQSQLVCVLNSAAGQVVSNLESHQKQLANILDVYAKSNENKE